MRLTIIRADNTVYIGGVPKAVDCSSLPADLHAVQWYGEQNIGWTEPKRVPGQPVAENTNISSIEPYQSLIDAWNNS